MDKTLAAYFLCAGYGTRLRFFTDRIPKPALTFQGRSALEINYRRVRPLLPAHVLCNTHHQYAEMEKAAMRFGMQILYEKEILGTGGCLWNARHILGNADLFLVHNGDLIHDIDLAALVRHHKASGDIATLSGIFRTAFNTLSCSVDGRLLGICDFEPFDTAREVARLTFSGVAVYNREFLDFTREGTEDIKRYWVDALKAGRTIGVVNCSQSAAWFDFGTPQGLWEAAKYQMEVVNEFSHGYYPLMRETRPYVSNEAGQEDLPEMLRNVLILEETALPITEGTSNCVIGRDFRWEIKP